AWAESLHEHALLNAESAVALSFLILLFLRGTAKESLKGDADLSIWWLAAIPAVIALAFAGILNAPFLYDDYTHITDAAQASWASIAQQFGPVEHKPGLFFRPVGFAIYWWHYQLLSGHPELWHPASLALHVICAFLVFCLIRLLGLSRLAGLAGALLFAMNGVTAEAVAWIDARFDLIATLLVLLSLILIFRYADTGVFGWMAGALAAGVCAMLTKESAFALPLLASCLPVIDSRLRNRRIWRAVLSMAILSAVLFAYRWWALGGIGGYGTRLSIYHSLNALFFRQWALLFFPLKWAAAGPLARAAACAIAVVLLVSAWIAKPSRGML